MRGDARVFNIERNISETRQTKNAMKVIFLIYFNGKEKGYMKEHNNTIG